MLVALIAGLIGADDLWQGDEETRADKIRLYRDYTLGKPLTNVTQKQRTILNLSGDTDLFIDFTVPVIRSVSDRLILSTIVSDNAEWVQDTWDTTEITAVQSELYFSALRDGDCYIGVMKDDSLSIHINYAFDGTTGIIPYQWDATGVLNGAVKVSLSDDLNADTIITIYGETAFSTYQLADESIEQLEENVAYANGVFPLIQFSYQRQPDWRGFSDLVQVLPLQDALNRSLVDLLIASALTAAQVLFARGFEPKEDLEPGMTYQAGIGASPEILPHLDLKAVPQGNLTTYIEQMDKLADFIAQVKNRPLKLGIGANASGEAQKQRESGLLATLRSLQSTLAPAWELVWKGLARLDGFELEPAIIWTPAEVREDKVIIEEAKLVHDVVGSEKLFLEMISSVTEMSEQEIGDFIAEEEEKRIADFQRYQQQYNPFGTDPNTVGEDQQSVDRQLS